MTSFITGSDANHIRNVLRLKPGHIIYLVDGTGREYEAQIVSFSEGAVEVSLIRMDYPETESQLRIVVAQALLKDKKMDMLIRHLTELGMTSWIPFIAARSVSRPDNARLRSRSQRWEKIAREAVKQCRRTRAPEIHMPMSFEDALHMSSACNRKIIFWENASRGFLLSDMAECNSIFIMLGPEGGFTQAEVDSANECGFVTAGLGPRILRAETATLAACSLIQFLFGDMGCVQKK